MSRTLRNVTVAALASLALVAVAGGVVVLRFVRSWSERPFVEARDRASASALELLVSHGRLSLGDLRGRLVVLEVWTTWCGACRLLAPKLGELQAAYAEDVTVLAVNADLDRFGDLEAYVAAQPEPRLWVALLPPERRDFGGALLDLGPLGPVAAFPTIFLLDRDGRVAGKYVGSGSWEALELAIERLLREPGRGGAPARG